MCGGTPPAGGLGRDRLGLSPRVRGNHYPHHSSSSMIGSIPACAGEPGVSSCCALRLSVYPRVCGGTVLLLRMSAHSPGLSPRVRGNREESDNDD